MSKETGKGERAMETIEDTTKDGLRFILTQRIIPGVGIGHYRVGMGHYHWVLMDGDNVLSTGASGGCPPDKVTLREFGRLMSRAVKGWRDTLKFEKRGV